MPIYTVQPVSKQYDSRRDLEAAAGVRAAAPRVHSLVRFLKALRPLVLRLSHHCVWRPVRSK